MNWRKELRDQPLHALTGAAIVAPVLLWPGVFTTTWAFFGIAAVREVTEEGNPVTANTPAERDLAAEAVREAGLPLRRDMLPAMTGEDFAWYLEHRPGVFAWIGNGPADGGRELHNSNYDFNDAILPNAAGYLAGVAKRALAAAG